MTPWSSFFLFLLCDGAWSALLYLYATVTVSSIQTEMKRYPNLLRRLVYFSLLSIIIGTLEPVLSITLLYPAVLVILSCPLAVDAFHLSHFGIHLRVRIEEELDLICHRLLVTVSRKLFNLVLKDGLKITALTDKQVDSLLYRLSKVDLSLLVQGMGMAFIVNFARKLQQNSLLTPSKETTQQNKIELKRLVSRGVKNIITPRGLYLISNVSASLDFDELFARIKNKITFFTMKWLEISSMWSIFCLPYGWILGTVFGILTRIYGDIRKQSVFDRFSNIPPCLAYAAMIAPWSPFAAAVMSASNLTIRMAFPYFSSDDIAQIALFVITSISARIIDTMITRRDVSVNWWELVATGLFLFTLKRLFFTKWTPPSVDEEHFENEKPISPKRRTRSLDSREWDLSDIREVKSPTRVIDNYM
jgi:hypothetical protein